MTFTTHSVMGAWWKQLSDHLYERTGRRLRGLQIRKSAGRVLIFGRVPSEEVLRQAEEAALEIVPEQCLALMLEVDKTASWSATVAPPKPPHRPRRRESPLNSMTLYWRLRNLRRN